MLKNNFARQKTILSKLLAILLNPGVQCLLLFRLSSILVKSKATKWLGIIFWRTNLFLTGADIHPKAKLGSDIIIYHTYGIVIGETSIIGNGVKIMHGVTLGSVNQSLKTKRHPTIEDNVMLGANCSILGDITIGANTKIGANATIIKSIHKNSVVVNKMGIIL